MAGDARQVLWPAAHLSASLSAMDEPALVRRLTTIIAIDVVGFSTMSARDEEHALDLLGARMADGRGDGEASSRPCLQADGRRAALAEFVSPVEAVRAALEIQEAMRSANATAGPNDQLVLRIGINLGDIVESGDDLMGDAVNVAVRLESIAPHGGICVSAAHLRADRRQAHPGRRGHGRAARQEHPAPHPRLSTDDREARHRSSRRGSAARAQGDRVTSSLLQPASAAVVAVVAIGRRLADARKDEIRTARPGGRSTAGSAGDACRAPSTRRPPAAPAGTS